jgi:signal transduction histidine kinase
MSPLGACPYDEGMTSALPPTDTGNDDDDVPVIAARSGYTALMIVLSMMMNLGMVAFSGNYYLAVGNSALAGLKMLATVVGIAAPFILLWRAKRPYIAVLLASGLTLIFQLDSLLVVFCVAGVVARGSNKRKNLACVALGFVASFVAVVSDMLLPAKYSFWMLLFTNNEPSQALHPADSGITGLAWMICILIPMVEIGLAIAFGTVIKSMAMARRSVAQARSERQRANDIQMSLSNTQIADSIAAEAHDTLAHSLSLIAVNATSLGADVEKLRAVPADPQLQTDIQRRADDLRGQAAGALDEAHSIIDMLRHPDEVAKMLAPGEGTALTQQALDALFTDVRDSGTQLNLWVDIRGLSALNPAIGKIAFRAIQEGLTNARRHAPGVPVSLSISVIPTTGISITMTNPMPAVRVQAAADSAHGGNGLPGLTQRIVESNGTCAYGVDTRGVFHLDVKLPFVPIS